MVDLSSFAPGGIAVVIGASGGIGAALTRLCEESGRFGTVLALSRRGHPAVDIEDEATIASAAEHAASLGPIRLVIVATGILHGDGIAPEKSLRQIDPASFAKVFAINATGPALVMKHFFPLLPREGKSAFAALSAKVGSIGDNRLGGWPAYRSSKAALNQLVRTAAVELARGRSEALCVAIHPGTVETSLSAPFARSGLSVSTPLAAARDILACLDKLHPRDSGGFFDRNGQALPW